MDLLPARFVHLVKTRIYFCYMCKIFPFATETRPDNECSLIFLMVMSNSPSNLQSETAEMVMGMAGDILHGPAGPEPDKLTCEKLSWLGGKAHLPNRHGQSSSHAMPFLGLSGKKQKGSLNIK